jgi:zinc resistance-associated protein
MPTQSIAAILTVLLIALSHAVINRAHAQGGDRAMSLERLDPDLDAWNTYAQSDRQSNRLKQNLGLSAEQEKLWTPVEEALNVLQEQRRSSRSAMGASEQSDQVERLRRRAELTSQRADALKKLVDAMQPLWATLSAEQKRELTQNLSRGLGRPDQEPRMSRHGEDGMSMHQRHHRGDWRYKDEDRAGRDRRDMDERSWRDGRDRMMSRRGDDGEDDRDEIRGNRFRQYSHRWSHDDYRPRARRFERCRYEFDRRLDRDDCRCYRHD